jgi:hypothetical protein
MPTHFRDKQVAVCGNKHITRSYDIGPLFTKFTLGSEKLQATILPIGDDHSTSTVNSDSMRQVKLSLLAPWLTPRQLKVTGR